MPELIDLNTAANLGLDVSIQGGPKK